MVLIEERPAYGGPQWRDRATGAGSAAQAVMGTEDGGRRPGRPSYQPTDRDRKQVRMMSGMGIPDYDIAKMLQVSTPTLRKYFAEELECGHIEANTKVAMSLFRMATHPDKPNVAAAIFWCKTRMRWAEASDDDVGKKTLANEHAKTAERNTGWDGLLLQ